MAVYSTDASLSVIIDGEGFTMEGTTADYNNVQKTALDEDTLTPAKVGELTTRTDNETGTLTMTTGHGITTGARLDLYWEDGDGAGTPGSRRGITVGTVSGNSVPIGADNSGSGDNLPLVNTAITAMVPHYESVGSFDMSTALAWGASISGLTDGTRCTISLGNYTTAYAEGGSITLGGTTYGTVAAWAAENQGTNPLAAATTVNRIYVSHGDSENETNVFKFSVGLP